MYKSRFIITMVNIIVSCLVISCSSQPSADTVKKERPPVPVMLAQVSQKDVPLEIETVGSVEALAMVQIKARVNGEVLTVHLKEGQDVKAGDPLVTIDPAPYQLLLKEAQARLARDLALARKAQADLRRNTALAEKAVVSQQDFEQLRAAAESADATARADQALVENLTVQLSWCYIKAPINGRTGSLLIDRGNLIKATDDNKYLLTINQIEPIGVAFAVPEQYIGRINRALAQNRELQVKARVADEEVGDRPAVGRLDFVDNSVDTATGTIRLKATFPNQDRRLWPGQVVRVVLTLAVQAGAIVVPSQAVQTSQAGNYVFVIGSDRASKIRPVKVARQFGGDAVIEQGLTPGETVVTDGQLLLTDGTKVVPKEAGRPSGSGDKPARAESGDKK